MGNFFYEYTKLSFQFLQVFGLNDLGHGVNAFHFWVSTLKNMMVTTL